MRWLKAKGRGRQKAGRRKQEAGNRKAFEGGTWSVHVQLGDYFLVGLNSFVAIINNNPASPPLPSPLPCALAFGLEMAPLFAKRLDCFYCGHRSAQTDRDFVRKWQCTHCEAVNYLDEVGRISLPLVGDSRQLTLP